MGLRVELRFDLVAGTAGPGHAGLALAGVGAAALNHEALDDAVKRGAVVEFLVREFLEVFDGFWSDVGPEGDRHFTVGSLEDGVFRRRF